MILLFYLIIISTAASAVFALPIKRQIIPNTPTPGFSPTANMLAGQQDPGAMQPPASNPMLGGNPFQTTGLAQQELSILMQNPALRSQMSPSLPGTLDPTLQAKLQDLNGITQLASSIGQTLQGTANALSSTSAAWTQIFNAWTMQQPLQSGQFPPTYPQQPSTQMGQQQYSIPAQQPGIPPIQQAPVQPGQQPPLPYSQQGPGQMPNLQLFAPQPGSSQGQQQGAQVQSFGGMGKIATQRANVASSSMGTWSHATPQEHSKANAQRKAVQSTNQPPTRFHRVKSLPNRHMFKMLHRQKLDRQDDDDDGW